jgi:hypothetical protein
VLLNADFFLTKEYCYFPGENFMKNSGIYVSWFGLLFILSLLINSCQFPYNPHTQPPPEGEQTKPNDTGTIGTGYLYPVNIGQQTCNPSISQSTEYSGCMLWLGFERVSVNVPGNLNGYSITKVVEHDRLTICDTSNTVKWFFMLSDTKESGEFQCPEWSTHPDYLACLVGSFTQPYSGYAVRISDKKSLQVCNKKLEEFSTPHFWMPDTVNNRGIAVDVPEYDSNGFVIKEQVHNFFGTIQFKFVYTLFQRGGTLYYVDYSSSGKVEPIPLNKPEGFESWYCHSPLISPDGGWVTYHCFPNATQGASYRSYIQKLSPSSKPVLIAENASDPHWWIDRSDNNRYYIVYAVTPGAYLSEFNYSDVSIEKSGDAGATLIQRLKGTWRDAPSFLGTLTPDETFTACTLIKLPFKGGLSPDGSYLCTAYKYAYLMKLK